MKTSVLWIMFLIGLCGTFYGFYIMDGSKQGPLPVQVRSAPATAKEPSHIDYVVAGRWGYQRIIFTTGLDGALNHIFIESADGRQIILHPDKIEVLVAGAMYLVEFEWKVWEERFALVRREATTKPSSTQPAKK